MAIFTLGNFSVTSSTSMRGQTITPSVPGPDGTGSPGAANPVYLTAFSLGYNSSDTSGRATTAYLYSYLPILTDLNAGTGAMATCLGYSDGNAFGGSNNSRTWTFDRVMLDPSATYYVLFETSQTAYYKASNNYAGGKLVQASLGLSSSLDAQFEAVLSDI